jgi:4-hydroxybenzoate polyprenyltransferase
MKELKNFVVGSAYVWAFVIGAMAGAAWFGLPLWSLIYFISVL